MDVNQFLKEEFLSAWNAKTFRSIDDSIDLVKDAFNISAVDLNVNRKINESFDRATQERYQRTTLRELTRQYADELYTRSNGGININESIILQAKQAIKTRGCSVQPC